jgi:hypothetical protein
MGLGGGGSGKEGKIGNVPPKQTQKQGCFDERAIYPDDDDDDDEPELSSYAPPPPISIFDCCPASIDIASFRLKSSLQIPIPTTQHMQTSGGN